jgi:hypothetical protein
MDAPMLATPKPIEKGSIPVGFAEETKEPPNPAEETGEVTLYPLVFGILLIGTPKPAMT